MISVLDRAERPPLAFPIFPDLYPTEGEPPAGGEGNPGGEGGDPPAGGDGDPGAGGGGEGGQGGGLLNGKPPAGGDGDPGGKGGQHFQIPEKFVVKGADGAEDWQGTALKVAQSYQHLEKRMGSGDLPPESAEGYQLENYLPEGYERNAEAEKPLLGKFHELGLSNKQAQGVMSLYGEVLGNALATEKTSMESAMQRLQSEVWTKPGEYQRNLDRSNFALSLADDALVQRITNNPQLMNNPDVIELLAFFGSEFEEDRPPEDLTPGEIEDMESLRHSEAYLDPKHPDHKRTVEKVSAYYARKGAKK